jgi:hypothetical protein
MPAFCSPAGATVNSQGRKPLGTIDAQMKNSCSPAGATVSRRGLALTVAPPGLHHMAISNAIQGLASPGYRRSPLRGCKEPAHREGFAGMTFLTLNKPAGALFIPRLPRPSP